MAKTDRLTLRLPDFAKAALAQAAAEDMRSMASMAEKIITEWLRANGLLNAEAVAAKRAGFASVHEKREAEIVLDRGIAQVIGAMDQGEITIREAAEIARLPPERQREIIGRDATPLDPVPERDR